MEVKFSAAIFLLQICFIYCTTMDDAKNGITKCCKVAYDGNAESENACTTSLTNQISSGVVEFLIGKKFKQAAENAQEKVLLNYLAQEDAKKEMEGKTEEERKKVGNKYYELHKDEIIKAGTEGRNKGIKKFEEELKSTCENAHDVIEGLKSPDIFTAEMFATVIASGAIQFRLSDWEPYIEFVKADEGIRENLKVYQAGIWQMLYYLDSNILTHLKGNDDGPVLVSPPFVKFMKWLFENYYLKETLKTCKLDALLRIYDDYKQEINGDINTNRTEIENRLKKCSNLV